MEKLGISGERRGIAMIIPAGKEKSLLSNSEAGIEEEIICNSFTRVIYLAQKSVKVICRPKGKSPCGWLPRGDFRMVG